MRLQLICVGTQCPRWINEGFTTYWQRLALPFKAELIEINTAKRSKAKSLETIKQQEADTILAAIPKRSHLVVLDERGQSWNTQQLAVHMQTWLESGNPTTLVIGGPDGLASNVLAHAKQVWSMSNLTFPHPLVRVMVAEQLYRAQSILANHPYHRS